MASPKLQLNFIKMETSDFTLLSSPVQSHPFPRYENDTSQTFYSDGSRVAEVSGPAWKIVTSSCPRCAPRGEVYKSGSKTDQVVMMRLPLLAALCNVNDACNIAEAMFVAYAHVEGTEERVRGQRGGPRQKAMWRVGVYFPDPLQGRWLHDRRRERSHFYFEPRPPQSVVWWSTSRMCPSTASMTFQVP